MSDDKQRSIAKTYTRARKFPQLIGTTPDGKRILGGPYTYTQFIGAGVVGVVLWQTTGIWATGSFVRNFMVFTLIIGLTVWGLGRLPLGGRNPLSMAHGVGKALSGGVQAPKVRGPSPRRQGIRALTGDVMIIETSTFMTERATSAPTASTSLRSAARAEKSAKTKLGLRGARRNPELSRTDDPVLNAEPVLHTSASTNADRLLAMAAASRSTREGV